MKICAVDCETTGLDPDNHEIWELALIEWDEQADTEEEHVWHFKVDLTRADPFALNIGHYHDRSLWEKYNPTEDEVWRMISPTEERDWAQTFVSRTRGAHIVGAIPSFDMERIWRKLKANGQVGMWHYHIIDVEALAVGWLRGRFPEDEKFALPWDSKALTRAIGLDPDDYDVHTGLGDARWALDMYRQIIR